MIKQLFSFRPGGITTLNDRLQFAAMILIRMTLIVAIGWSIIARDWETLGMSILTYASTFIPAFLERQYRLYFPIEYHLVIVVFLYGSLFLGEVGDVYERFWWWDLMLHTSSGIVLGFVGFLILYIMHLQQRLKMSASMIAFLSFCVALAAGAVWEIFEYAADQLVGATMQNGNMDTMGDLVVDALGALMVSIAGYFHFKKVRLGFIARHIDNFVAINPQLFRRIKRKRDK